MIVPALLAIHTIFTQDAWEFSSVKAFDVAARIGLESGVALPPYPEAGAEPEYAASLTDRRLKEAGLRTYQYNRATFYLNVKTHRFQGFDDNSRLGALRNPDGSLAARKVSDAQATTLAQRFYNAAGWPGEIKIYKIDDGRGLNNRSLQILYVPAKGGVPYHDDWQALMFINRETGQLDGFEPTVDDLPVPPLSVSPRGALAQGRLAALNFGTELRGESLAESPDVPLKLCVWYPSHAGLPGNPVPLAQRGYSSSVRAALAARRGILAYSGMLLGGSRGAGLYITIDANTGEILDRADLLPDGGAGGSGGGSPAGDVAVPKSARPWRVAKGGAGWKAWSAPVSAALAPTDGAAPKSGKLVLSDGKLALVAAYDPKTNLLGVDGKAYRPGPALANLLRRRTKEGTQSGTPARTSKP